MFGLGALPSIIVGFCLAMSSTALVLQILSDRGELATNVGRVTLSILLLQDLGVVPGLAVLGTFQYAVGADQIGPGNCCR
jgi:CPA2 family monovalent cation:H+ antiporter-2